MSGSNPSYYLCSPLEKPFFCLLRRSIFFSFVIIYSIITLSLFNLYALEITTEKTEPLSKLVNLKEQDTEEMLNGQSFLTTFFLGTSESHDQRDPQKSRKNRNSSLILMENLPEPSFQTNKVDQDSVDNFVSHLSSSYSMYGDNSKSIYQVVESLSDDGKIKQVDEASKEEKQNARQIYPLLSSFPLLNDKENSSDLNGFSPIFGKIFQLNPLGSPLLQVVADSMGLLRESLRNIGANLPNAHRNVIVSYRQFRPLGIFETLEARSHFLKSLKELLSSLMPIRSVYLRHLGMEIFEVPYPLGISDFIQAAMNLSRFVESVHEDQNLDGFDDESGSSRNSSQLNQILSQKDSGPRKLYAETTPNDPYFENQWALMENGSSHWGVEAPRAWSQWTGSELRVKFVVAIIDSGVDYTHPDLHDNIWRNELEIPNNGIDDDGNGFIDDVNGWDFINGDNDPMDDNGHGTASAGIIAAKSNNNLGVSGLCWGCKLMIIKALNSKIKGTVGGFIRAIDYAIGQGAKVSNNSYGGRGSNFAGLHEAVRRAELAGMIFVAAAGNYRGNNDNDVNPVYPASYNIKNVVSVAAITRTGKLACFSSYGKSQVDIAAPGEGILTTTTGGGYKTVDGTSFAVPFVAGAFALIWSREPNLRYEEVIVRVIKNVRIDPQLDGIIRTSGVLDIYKAMTDDDNILNVIPHRHIGPTPKCEESNPCNSNAECRDITDGQECICKKGFQGNGVTCIDIDECTFNPCGPAATCTNTIGSFECKCNSGFRQIGDSCEDINECLESFSCPRQAHCENFVGSFDCLCPVGSAWNGKKRSDSKCLRINSPSSGPCINNGNCGFNTLCQATGSLWFQSRNCQCLDGYSPLNESESCFRTGIIEEHVPNYMKFIQARASFLRPRYYLRV